MLAGHADHCELLTDDAHHYVWCLAIGAHATVRGFASTHTGAAQQAATMFLLS
jgi:hypothetical protein